MSTLTRTSAPACIGIGLFSYQFGGSERVAVDLALEYSRRGHRVVCFAFHDSDGPFRKVLEASGIRCLDLNYGSTGGPLRRLAYYVRLWRAFRREHISSLHVQHHGALILCGPPAMLAGVKRVVMTEHGLQALMERSDARKLTRRYARFATDITVVEPGQADYFKAVLGIPDKKVHCIANGVRVQKCRPGHASQVRVRLGIQPDRFVFMYVGRLSPVKDLPTLLQAFAELPAAIRQVALLYLVGDGVERHPLEVLAAELGIEAAVTFLGAKSDVTDLLAAADAFVMSSLSEGLPMALLEAMAAGLPCVATAVGGIPSLLGEDAGITVPPSSPRQLSAAMGAVATSATLRQSLSGNALRTVLRSYDLDSIAEQYLSLLIDQQKP